MPKLIKNVITSYVPGDPGDPGTPGTIAQPGYWNVLPQTTCSLLRTSVYNPSPGFGLGNSAGFGNNYSVSSTPICTTTYVLSYVPPVAASTGIPYRAPTAAQINVSLNVGWNSYASTIGKLNAGTYLEYTIKPGTTGALLSVGYAGREGSPIGSFTHGLMTDVSTISVFENGIVGATLGANAPGTKIRIARLSDGRIIYSVGNVFHISTAPAYLPTEDLYVYGMLYSGYDEVSSAAFVASDLVSETGATLSGALTLSARAEQFVETSISGVGALVASPFPTATLSGAGALTAWAEQFVEANLGGTGTLWSYAETSRPTTAYLSGTGSLVASPFPTASLQGMGSLTSSTGPTSTLSGSGKLTAEAYRGQLTEAAIVGVGKIVTFANVGGRGYGELPVFVGLGGDTDYGQGRGDLPYFVSGATNGQSDYVPPPINRGYGLLPFFVGAARGVDIGIGTGSASLPEFVGVGGDYSYGFGSGSLPMFVSAGYSGFIPDDMLVLISPMLGTMPLNPQIDLVLVLNSSGQLTSTLSMTREQALALMSALQQSSVFSMLGTYSMSALSSMQGMSLAAFNVNSRADLYENGAVWVVNLDNSASVQYEQYGFNSFLQRGNDYYGVANDGIYKLSGTTDNGDPIKALIELAKSNLGIAQEKALPNVYLSASSDGALVLKVVVGDNTHYYTARSSSQTLDKHRVDLGRGLKDIYWQLGVKNENGDDFNIAGIELLPAPSKRRI